MRGCWDVRILFTALLFLLCPADSTPGFQDTKTSAPIRVLLLSGGERSLHGYRKQARNLSQYLEDSGKYVVSVNEDSGVLEQTSLAKYQLIIVNNDRRSDEHKLTQAQQQALIDFVAQGKGLVSIHGFCCAAPDWKPEMRGLLGAVYSKQGQPESKVDPVTNLPIKVRQPPHPIMATVKDFQMSDDLYYQLQMASDFDSIAVAEHGGKQWPVAWIRKHEKGRVFVTVLGHCSAKPDAEDPQTQKAEFRKLLLRGIEWAATGTVSPDAQDSE